MGSVEAGGVGQAVPLAHAAEAPPLHAVAVIV
jgi:hypothetical protein